MTTDTSFDPSNPSQTVEETSQVSVEEGTNPNDAAPALSAEMRITELQSALARAQADYQNLLMRVERDKTDMAHFLTAKILLPLLTQIDNLERAVKLKE
jgi:molecular chaperone GrpE (heat shock protein)